MGKMRYHLNEYWLRLAMWAMDHVQYEVRSKRGQVIEIKQAIATMGMQNANILINWDANTLKES